MAAPTITTWTPVYWLPGCFDAELLRHPIYLALIFWPLRLLAILFFAYYSVCAIRRDGGGLRWRHYANGTFVIYLGLAALSIAYACCDVYLGLDPHLSIKIELESKMTLVICIADLLSWWGLTLMVYGVGYFRYSAWIRKAGK